MSPLAFLDPEFDPSAELERVEAELCRRSFAAYVRRAWREIDPAPLVWGWHVQAMCDHLQAVTEGRIQRLAINIPPGHAKSMIVSVLWPTWVWGPARRPWWRMLGAAYDLDLSMRDSVKARTLIQTRWYQTHFTDDPRMPGHSWQLMGDQNVKSFYSNDALGFRLCVAIGAGTGHRGDALVIDDPISADKANSKEQLQKVIRWKTETMSSRFNDQAKAQEVLVMQRLHEDDLSGYLLKAGGWVHLKLPSEFDPEHPCECETCRAGVTPIGWRDPRKVKGELLFPAKFPREVLAQAKSPQGMGAIAFEGQHQQWPMPAKGGVIQREFFARRWHYPKASAPLTNKPVEGLVRREYDPRTARPNMRFIVTDAAFKKTEDTDLVAVGVCDLIMPDLLVVDWDWRRMSFLETIDSIQNMRRKWSTGTIVRVSKIAIEDKANGPAVIEVLKQKVPGVLALEPMGSKEARVYAAAPFMQAGNVWVPEAHPQLDAAIREAIGFPKASNDDWIDMLAYAVLVAFMASDFAWLERFVKVKPG